MHAYEPELLPSYQQLVQSNHHQLAFKIAAKNLSLLNIAKQKRPFEVAKQKGEATFQLALLHKIIGEDSASAKQALDSFKCDRYCFERIPIIIKLLLDDKEISNKALEIATWFNDTLGKEHELYESEKQIANLLLRVKCESPGIKLYIKRRELKKLINKYFQNRIDLRSAMDAIANWRDDVIDKTIIDNLQLEFLVETKNLTNNLEIIDIPLCDITKINNLVELYVNRLRNNSLENFPFCDNKYIDITEWYEASKILISATKSYIKERKVSISVPNSKMRAEEAYAKVLALSTQYMLSMIEANYILFFVTGDHLNIKSKEDFVSFQKDYISFKEYFFPNDDLSSDYKLLFDYFYVSTLATKAIDTALKELQYDVALIILEKQYKYDYKNFNWSEKHLYHCQSLYALAISGDVDKFVEEYHIFENRFESLHSIMGGFHEATKNNLPSYSLRYLAAFKRELEYKWKALTHLLKTHDNNFLFLNACITAYYKDDEVAYQWAIENYSKIKALRNIATTANLKVDLFNALATIGYLLAAQIMKNKKYDETLTVKEQKLIKEGADLLTEAKKLFYDKKFPFEKVKPYLAAQILIDEGIIYHFLGNVNVLSNNISHLLIQSRQKERYLLGCVHPNITRFNQDNVNALIENFTNPLPSLEKYPPSILTIIYYYNAYALRTCGERPKKIIKEYEKIFQLDPSKPDNWGTLACYYCTLKHRQKEGILFANKFLENVSYKDNNKLYLEVLIATSNCILDMQQPYLAKNYVDELRRLKPDHPSIKALDERIKNTKIKNPKKRDTELRTRKKRTELELKKRGFENKLQSCEQYISFDIRDKSTSVILNHALHCTQNRPFIELSDIDKEYIYTLFWSIELVNDLNNEVNFTSEKNCIINIHKLDTNNINTITRAANRRSLKEILDKACFTYQLYNIFNSDSFTKKDESINKAIIDTRNRAFCWILNI